MYLNQIPAEVKPAETGKEETFLDIFKRSYGNCNKQFQRNLRQRIISGRDRFMQNAGGLYDGDRVMTCSTGKNDEGDYPSFFRKIIRD